MTGNEPRKVWRSVFPARAGSTTNSALNTRTAPPIAQPIAFSETCSSSGICWFADQVSALYPSPIDSPRPMTPRTIGMFR